MLIWRIWTIWGDERTVSYVLSTAVVGPIPSLATIFNNLQPAISKLGCIWLHFYHVLSYPTTRTTVMGAALLTYSVSLRTALRCDSGTTCW